MINEWKYNLAGDKKEIYRLFDSVKGNYPKRLKNIGKLTYILGSNEHGRMTKKAYIVLHGKGTTSKIIRKENQPVIIFGENQEDIEETRLGIEKLLRTEIKLDKKYKRKL